MSVELVRNDWLIIATIFSYSDVKLFSVHAAITLLGIASPRADKSSVSFRIELI